MFFLQLKIKKYKPTTQPPKKKPGVPFVFLTRIIFNGKKLSSSEKGALKRDVELVARLKQQFYELDTDGNGTLDRREFIAGGEALGCANKRMLRKMFKKCDLTQDGRISRDVINVLGNKCIKMHRLFWRYIYTFLNTKTKSVVFLLLFLVRLSLICICIVAAAAIGRGGDHRLLLLLLLL